MQLTKFRRSFTGRIVKMVLVRGKWQPQNGSFEAVKVGKMTLNILRHDLDPKTPKAIDPSRFWEFTPQ